LLRRETILRELALPRKPDYIVSVGHHGRRGNPCVFPRAFFPAQLSLNGDMGGNEVIKSNEDKLFVLQCRGRAGADRCGCDETLRELNGGA
jgi:CTP:molybdopterin cytidylyltransferase MocA